MPGPALEKIEFPTTAFPEVPAPTIITPFTRLAEMTFRSAAVPPIRLSWAPPWTKTP